MAFFGGVFVRGPWGLSSFTGRRMAQTAAHPADRVIPSVPTRQWLISLPKRLRWILADRPPAMMALSQMFLEEIERVLCDEEGVPTDSLAAGQARPRLAAVRSSGRRRRARMPVSQLPRVEAAAVRLEGLMESVWQR
jgi:hypothetical protein